ncbi:methyltransferase domain-containing protein [Fragilaria crotonensis]|nr:methyltransferase domain-containing protein [Fragilaria crotonensis]
MQAQLAVNLVADPDFCANEEDQRLEARSWSAIAFKEFWEPVGQLTSAMDGEDKVNLLAHIIPRFGSGDPAQESALGAFVSGMKPTFAYLRSRCPSWTESDVQLLGTELLAAEVLKGNRSSREDFAKWIAALTEDELKTILQNRKKPRIDATAELEEYTRLKEENERKEVEKQEKLRAQIEAARKNRTLDFNARSGKFEVPEKKK